MATDSLRSKEPYGAVLGRRWFALAVETLTAIHWLSLGEHRFAQFRVITYDLVRIKHNSLRAPTH